LTQPQTLASRLRARLDSIAAAADAHAQAHPEADPFAPLRRAWARLSHSDGLERLIPVGLCALLVSAAIVSTLPTAPSSPAATPPPVAVAAVAAGAAPDARYGSGDGPLAPDVSDLYLGDGSIPNSLQNPGVGLDATTQLRTYTVQAGDTFNEIAAQFGLAPSTLYWANNSKVPDPGALRVGQPLLILPMDGLLVKVGAKDTLTTLAAKYQVALQDIIDANNLPEATVVLGETLIIPGASGGPVPKSKSAPTSSGGWVWPVYGSNYISQYYWSGHHAIDIAAPYGTAVMAAASGTVVYAGWKSYNQGGNVIWIMHGTKLYSTYNHLSAWSVRVGQRVSAGQLIGRIGTSGVTTGPHLDFEIWLSAPWALGNASTTTNPCRYLAGC